DRTAMIGIVGSASFASEESCLACQTEIPGGEEFCLKCGYQRGTWQGDGASASANGAAEAVTAAASTTSGPTLWTLSAGAEHWPLGSGEHALGRGEVEVRIDDGYASRRHALLQVTADTVTLTDLGSSNGTFVNDRRLEANAPEPITDGGSFRIANTNINLRKQQKTDEGTVADGTQETIEQGGTQVMNTTAHDALDTDNEGTAIDPDSQLEPGKEGLPATHASESHWELQREGGDTIPIALGETTLGRKAEATQVLEGDSFVSGVHCRLIATENRLEVTDLNSTNGTFVNDARLDSEQPWKLTDGDRLRVGQTAFVVNNSKLTEGEQLEADEPTE
ncbi:MAG: FHA domain-containing protein, partial [bacterium]|nr:FHA domain-containing protein [bacterium]